MVYLYITDSSGEYSSKSLYRSQAMARSTSSPTPPPQRPSSPQPITSYDDEKGVEPGDGTANRVEEAEGREEEAEDDRRISGTGEVALSKETKDRKNCLSAMKSILSADDSLAIKGV